MKFIAAQISDFLYGEVLQGRTSFGYNNYFTSYVHFKNLPKIVSEVEEIKKTINTK